MPSSVRDRRGFRRARVEWHAGEFPGWLRLIEQRLAVAFAESAVVAIDRNVPFRNEEAFALQHQRVEAAAVFGGAEKISPGLKPNMAPA